MYPLLNKDGVAVPYAVAMVVLTLYAFSAARSGPYTTLKTIAVTVTPLPRYIFKDILPLHL